MKFLDRVEERTRLMKLLNGADGALACLYGRRRCGKTRLLHECVAGLPNVIYYLADRSERSAQLARFVKEASRVLFVFATDAVNSEAIYLNRFREDIKPKMGWPKQLGHAPILIETGSVEIGLHNANAKKLMLWALNVDGTRAEEIPVSATATALKFTLDTAKLKAPSVYFELATK